MTDHDKELRKQILTILKGFSVSGGRFKERTDTIMQLITTDRERACREARIDELKNMLGQAREHTINDIERIMYHTKSKVDFIEAVKTDLIIDSIATLSTQEGGKK